MELHSILSLYCINCVLSTLSRLQYTNGLGNTLAFVKTMHMVFLDMGEMRFFFFNKPLYASLASVKLSSLLPRSLIFQVLGLGL